ncbi:hypothetical protein LY76DRAFT_215692 [Colletotrichum caudatum]|nr:hypothetical protein LY76DRAFT_215692 [Colletotrichum caudatum]
MPAGARMKMSVTHIYERARAYVHHLTSFAISIFPHFSRRSGLPACLDAVLLQFCADEVFLPPCGVLVSDESHSSDSLGREAPRPVSHAHRLNPSASPHERSLFFFFFWFLYRSRFRVLVFGFWFFFAQLFRSLSFGRLLRISLHEGVWGREGKGFFFFLFPAAAPRNIGFVLLADFVRIFISGKETASARKVGQRGEDRS